MQKLTHTHTHTRVLRSATKVFKRLEKLLQEEKTEGVLGPFELGSRRLRGASQ